MRRRSLVAVLALGALGVRVPAQTPPDSGRKEARAVRIDGRAPRIDGRLDDDAWQHAVFVAGFRQRSPREGAPATERTEVAFLYDDDALYVGARMRSADPRAVHALLTRRDHTGTSEQIIVSLDTYLDRRTAYSFGLTAGGVRLDYYHATDDEHSRDYTYDPVWTGKVARDSAGWTAEMRIPFSQLRFHASDHQVWGVNVKRRIPARNEDDFWVLVPKDETGWASRFAHLVGIAAIRPSRRLELAPYAASQANTRADVDPADPFGGRAFGAHAGGDLKMGLGSNLTLDATVNPDFGQVEADPAEVNLTAYETYFSERRPFFTEGRRLLEGEGPSYFYSRRIGAAPHGRAYGDYVDRPQSSTILGAAKITGRLPSGLSIAALGAVTNREYARTFTADSETGPAFGRTLVEPRTAYGVVRAQQEFGASGSTAGVIFTALHRALAPAQPLAAALDRDAYSGGADWNLRFRTGEYRLRGYAGFSAVAGDSEAVLRVQRSSAHYFQRPDARYVRLDSSRTALRGGTGSLRLSRESGRHWLWNVGGSARTPAFELNDAGRLTTADVVQASGTLSYRENRPGRVFRDYGIDAGLFDEWNFGGIRQATSPSLSANATWRNFWYSSVRLALDTRAFSDVLTRGGPLMATGAGTQVEAELTSNPARRVRYDVNAEWARDELGGRTTAVSGDWAVRPSDRWEFSVTPRYSRGVDTRQFIASRSGGSAATFGRRYVFATVDRSEIATQFRLNYVFTPDLSVEGYAEPFASSGRYSGYGELAAARSLALRIYGTGGTALARGDDGSLTVIDGFKSFTLDPDDFNVRSFRSNVVLRWEWRPGSTAFLVWQRNGYAQTALGSLVGPAGLRDAVAVRSDNTLVLKVSYWLAVR